MNRSIFHGAWKVVVTVIAFTCSQCPAFSQLQTRYFHMELFDIEDGLNQNVLYDFQTDKNGILWVHTVGKLQLFDGKNFIDVTHLLGDDALYGSFSMDGFPDLFFISKNKVYKLNPDTYREEKFPVLELPLTDYATEHARILYENPDQLFVSTGQDVIYRVGKKRMIIESTIRLNVKPLAHGTFAEMDLDDMFRDSIEYVGDDSRHYTVDLKTGNITAGMQFDSIASIAKISNDTFVTVDLNSINVFTTQGVHSIPLPAPVQPFISKFLMNFGNDKLLVGLKNGIYEFELSTMRFSTLYKKTGGEEVPELGARAIKSDRFGNIYFSTFYRGLIKLHPRNEGFNYIGAKAEGKNFVKWLNGSDKHNVILMATFEDGLYVFDTLGELKKHIVEFPVGVTQKSIKTILKLSESTFVVLGGDAFILKVDKGEIKTQKIPGFDKSVISYYTQCLADTVHDKYYISLWSGLLEFSGQSGLQHEFKRGHPVDGSFAISTYNDGYISAAYNRVTLFDNAFEKEVANWTIHDYGYSRSIIQQSANSILLATDVGLYHIRLEKDTFISDRIYDKIVYAILPGNIDGEFWFSTDYGLFRLNQNLQLTNYSKEIGLQENEFNTGSCYKSSSGKLYFGGINGITSFYPSEVSESRDVISPYISSLSINNEVIARYIHTPTENSYTLSARENNIGIELLARGNKSPVTYNYQYMMKGINNEWVDMGKENALNFHLAPGSYKFYYHINDGFNPDAQLENFLSFTIQQPLFKRWWFISAIVASLAGLGFYLFIMSQKRRKMKVLYENQLSQKLQHDRMRISRELHDNIGAQMATIKRSINFLISSNANLTPDEILKKMIDLEGISTQINQELRDTIWATQHEHISVFNFIARLKNYVFQTLGSDSPFRVHYVENCDTQVILGPFLGLNLHRICQEAITNAIKHSGASEFKICFDGNDRHFKVTIADNGKGFDMNSSSEGYGLKNIRQRASLIGAQLNMRSSPGEGTAIEIEITKSNSSTKSTDEWRQ